MAAGRTAVNAAFKRRFAALLERAGEKAELVVRKVALEMHTSLVMKSPVDTGRFRGNWVMQYAATPLVGTKTDKEGGATVAAAEAVLSTFQLGQKIYMTNSLPYAIPLEYGSSSQAPGGMVRITLAEFNQYLKKAVGEVRAT